MQSWKVIGNTNGSEIQSSCGSSLTVNWVVWSTQAMDSRFDWCKTFWRNLTSSPTMPVLCTSLTWILLPDLPQHFAIQSLRIRFPRCVNLLPRSNALCSKSTSYFSCIYAMFCLTLVERNVRVDGFQVFESIYKKYLLGVKVQVKSLVIWMKPCFECVYILIWWVQKQHD